MRHAVKNKTCFFSSGKKRKLNLDFSSITHPIKHHPTFFSSQTAFLVWQKTTKTENEKDKFQFLPLFLPLLFHRRGAACRGHWSVIYQIPNPPFHFWVSRSQTKMVLKTIDIWEKFCHSSDFFVLCFDKANSIFRKHSRRSGRQKTTTEPTLEGWCRGKHKGTNSCGEGVCCRVLKMNW